MDSVEAALSREVRTVQAPVGKGRSAKRTGSVSDTGRQEQAKEPETKPATESPVQPKGVILSFDGTNIAHFQATFIKDIPIFIPATNSGGWTSAVEKQIDVYAEESQGHYTRPVLLREAKQVTVLENGSICFWWKNGTRTYIAPGIVASFAVD